MTQIAPMLAVRDENTEIDFCATPLPNLTGKHPAILLLEIVH
jgi:hypothetical protein